MELYGMINHMNQFEYQDKIAEIEKEISIRKEKGEIPEKIVPDIDWTSFKFWKRKKQALRNNFIP